MGSSKKHKEKDKEREHKHKRKRRSRSRSKERRSRRKDREERRGKEEPQDKPRIAEPVEPEGQHASASGGGETSLSIDETNRIRAKLGLKPLDVPGSSNNAEAGGEEGEKPKEKEDVHAPPVNWGEQKKTEALREKMAILKQKRLMNKKLRKVKGLGDSDTDTDDMSKWVKRSRKMEKEKVLADKRAKLLEEMDEEFGISDLMDQEFKDKKKDYSARDLQGLTVQHEIDKFSDGRGVILTLKDKGILDKDEDDVLINVNMVDDEVAEKNVDNKKKKPEYKPYDEPEYDEYGMLKPNSILDKYDEDIDGNKKVKKSFTLGSGGKYDADEDREMERIRTELRQQGQTLAMPALTLASEYYTAEEAAAKFKKVKKKVRKIRKKTSLKADDLLNIAADQVTREDYGSRSRGRGHVVAPPEDMEEGENIDQVPEVIDYGHGDPNIIDYGHGIKAEPEVKTEPETEPSGRITLDPGVLSSLKVKVEEDMDVIGPDEDLTGVPVDDDEVENELHSALSKARKLKLKKAPRVSEQVVERVMSLQNPETDENAKGSQIVLNSISEFCRNLGEIPTYGLSGNREEDREEIMDVELELMEQKRRQEEIEEAASGWNEVDIDTQPVDITGEEQAVLEEEPIVTDGVGAALALAMKKGYLEKEVIKNVSAPEHSNLGAMYYSIEDKRYDDLDEKYRKRDRYGGGVISDFRDKDGYKPDVKLEYVDESGRCLNPKEAFRQLSHRFHGKGSGKKKQEKRMKKLEEEQLMKMMSSTDTPLNTLSLLQEKQKAEKSPFVVLSGNKGFTANTTSIAKP
ncbi:U4/U6.U5 tri-snRNP-associated protein 1-like [Haliotis rubra]|uniref:U4/U6.U5 tri-snRNP-associated protein 1-like n=1 Tax=Haliotis rubra TaxID=36100 RepID=UPI001EE52252|nr:U4/U6.U5 tri-snRNP-associated protein 1-like [Haliotis rubra]